MRRILGGWFVGMVFLFYVLKWDNMIMVTIFAGCPIHTLITVQKDDVQFHLKIGSDLATWAEFGGYLPVVEALP